MNRLDELLQKLPDLSDQSYRRLLLAMGHLFFLAYLLGCLVFYKERLLSFDSAYYTYHLLITDDFFIKHDRWISYLTQWFPLQVMRNGGSLQAFLQAYSVAFGAWFYLLYLLVVYGFKNVTGGVFYALAMGLAIRYKYYAAISEITFSLAIGAVLVAWLTSSYRPKQGEVKPWFWSVALLITVVLSGTHPVIIAPLLAFFAIDMVYNNRWKEVWNWGFIAFLLLFYAYTFTQLAENEYESTRIGVLSQLGEVLKAPDDYVVWHIIKRYWRVEYTLPIILIGLMTLAMFYAKHWWSASLFVLANIAWLLVNLGTYSYLNSHIYIMIDGYLALFGLIWAIPILFFVLRSEQRLIAVVLSAGLLLFSGTRIYNRHDFFTDRLSMLEETIAHYEAQELRKVRIQLDHFNWHKMWYPYSVPHETLILSALKGKEKTMSIYVNYDNHDEDFFIDGNKHAQDFLQYDHGNPVNWLPKQYFDLPKGEYVLKTWVAWEQ